MVAVIFIVIAFYSLPAGAAQKQSKAEQNFEILATQAAQARDANRVEEALTLYHQALRLRPRWGEGWFYLATLLYERDSWADAAQAFKQATNFNPRVGTSWVMLGLCEFKLGRYDDSFKHLQRGRQLGLPNNPSLWHVLLYHQGLLLLEKGDFETAQETLEKLSKENVKNEDLIIAIGLSILRIRPANLAKADATTREIIPHVGWAGHLVAQKKFDEALREYERLVTDFPKAPNVQYAYGYFLLVSHQDEKAIAAFQREIENTPNHLLARLMIADTKFRIKDFAGGLPYAEEAVKLYPRVPHGHYFLGLLLLSTNQTARAIIELETARAGLPNEPRVYFALGRAYDRAHRKADAERARATFTRLNKETEATKDAEGDRRSKATKKNVSDTAPPRQP